jgi:hypothetical protein
VNNPEVGMVHPENDPEQPKTTWTYDPHIDPALQFDSARARIEKLIDDALASGDTETMRDALLELKRLQEPYLNWAGKAERTSFEIDTVSLHVHERIDPASILAAIRKRMKGEKDGSGASFQPGLFDAPFENLPLRQAIDFYKHDKNWSNRLIAGGWAGADDLHRPALWHQIRLKFPAFHQQTGCEGRGRCRPDARTRDDQGLPGYLGIGHPLISHLSARPTALGQGTLARER